MVEVPSKGSETDHPRLGSRAASSCARPDSPMSPPEEASETLILTCRLSQSPVKSKVAGPVAMMPSQETPGKGASSGYHVATISRRLKNPPGLLLPKRASSPRAEFHPRARCFLCLCDGLLVEDMVPTTGRALTVEPLQS